MKKHNFRNLTVWFNKSSKAGKEFQRFLEIALRSTYEVMTSLEIAVRLDYCSKNDFNRLTAEADEIAAMLVGFSKSLSSDF